MGQVFATMTMIYGNFWKAQFKNNAANLTARSVWFRAFNDAGLNADDVRAGLEHCTLSVDSLPNLPQFIGICRALKPQAAHKRFEALPPPQGTWEERQARGKAEMAKLKGLFDD